MNWKEILVIVIGVLVALIVYDLFVRKMVTKSSLEDVDDLEALEDYESFKTLKNV